MNTPLITIGITCHNARETAARAVRSALAQSWPQTEIIIVDDASTDGTADMLGKEFPELDIVALPANKGVAAARNTIIEKAKGEFIAFFDDDDESTPDRVQKQYERLAPFNAGPAVCYSARTQIYPDGTARYEPTVGVNDNPIPHGPAMAARILFGKPVEGGFGSMATCSQMARTELYRELGGFDESFRRSEDTDFNIRAALTGAHFVGIAEPLVTQTMTLACDKRLEDEQKYAFELLDKHKDFIAAQTSYAFCKEWLEAKYCFLEGQKPKFMRRMAELFVQHPVLTAQRVAWALPNAQFNFKTSQFHNDAA